LSSTIVPTSAISPPSKFPSTRLAVHREISVNGFKIAPSNPSSSRLRTKSPVFSQRPKVPHQVLIELEHPLFELSIMKASIPIKFWNIELHRRHGFHQRWINPIENSQT
jgi:hypothetical protein